VLLFSFVFISALVAALTKSEGRTAEAESSSFMADERAAFEQMRRLEESLALAPSHARLGLNDMVVKNLHTGWENHGTGTWSQGLKQNATEAETSTLKPHNETDTLGDAGSLTANVSEPEASRSESSTRYVSPASLGAAGATAFHAFIMSHDNFSVANAHASEVCVRCTASRELSERESTRARVARVESRLPSMCDEDKDTYSSIVTPTCCQTCWVCKATISYVWLAQQSLWRRLLLASPSSGWFQRRQIAPQKTQRTQRAIQIKKTELEERSRQT